LPSTRAEKFCKTGLEKNPAAKNRWAGRVADNCPLSFAHLLLPLMANPCDVGPQPAHTRNGSRCTSIRRSGHREHFDILESELRLLKAENTEATRAIITATCSQVRRMAQRMLWKYPGVGRWTDADDVVQNVFIRLHRSLVIVQPDSVGKLHGLVTLEMRRELLDLARRYFGPEGIGTNYGGPVSDDPVSKETEPHTLLEWTEFHEQVARLPNAEREVFGLIWYDGLTQSEAAAVLGVSLTTIKRRWQSARVRLREAMCDDRP
jgi:RNA polymerase sigma factor (sigma-70 family)